MQHKASVPALHELVEAETEMSAVGFILFLPPVIIWIAKYLCLRLPFVYLD